MKSFKFTKMHGLGNDFVVIDGVNQSIAFNPDDIRLLSDRRLGVGCDQVLIVSPAQHSGDFTYAIYNADGTKAGHCGNGARCLAAFIHDKGLSRKKTLILEMNDKLIQTVLLDDLTVTVAMGKAIISEEILVDKYRFMPVTIGNAHVITRDAISNDAFLTISQDFQTDKRFEGVNVSIMKIIDDHHIAVKTFERGVGLTPACGSAATASAFLAITSESAQSPVTVQMPGGNVIVHLDHQQLFLTGPVVFVYDGVWHG